MAPSLLKNYFGLGAAAAPVASAEKEKTGLRALPANWYTSPEMFELEKRSIFSRRWLITTHKARFLNTGDWLRFEIAGYPFVLVKDREGEIRGFHNVCRHRAFPVVTEDQGTTKIFACKYHGWSYGLNGKLAKAPGYQDLDGFDKSKNGLFPVHVHVDRNGFIWVNLDGNEKPEVAWEDDFRDIDVQERYKLYNFADYDFDHSWEQEGEYNWKILADNFNECYHCQVAHPDVPAFANINSYSVDGKDGSIIHDAKATEEQIKRGLQIASTYYFPHSSMTVSPHFIMLQRFLPTSATHCVMNYQVFRNRNSSEDDFQLINQIYKRVMAEDKYLCVNTQKNLNRGVFTNGELHPFKERGPLYFQSVTRQIVLDHYNREQKEGREIWPARQQLPNNATTSKEDFDFCQNLTTQGKKKNRNSLNLAEEAGGCCGGMPDCGANSVAVA